MKINKNTIINALGTYLLVWLVLVSVDNLQDFSLRKYYESKERDYWVEYIKIEPIKEDFSVEEHPEFISVIDYQRPTAVLWNDILFCDKRNTGEFGYYTAYKTQTNLLKRDEVGTYTTPPWTYGDSNYKSPPSGSICYLKSEVQICPRELKDSNKKCRNQLVVTETFNFK